ncbi:transposase [Embleya sp. NPDC008237]|uniref:transposase n=1 Tax=Embleya sp. NPDC008237 TaxID=3363978 RepID=UPI0036E11B80
MRRHSLHGALAPEQNVDAVDRIHAGLAARSLLPAEHLVDSGYVTPATIHRAAIEHGVARVRPVRADPRGRASGLRQGGLRRRLGTADPHLPTRQRQPAVETRPQRRATAHLRALPTCRLPRCEDRIKCTGNAGGRGRQILLMPRPLQEIQNRVRREQETDDWKRHTAMHVGCEATVSETVRAHGLRNCRYRGRAKTHAQHVLVAAGTNIVRLSECILPGIVPVRTPRPFGRFRQLCDARFKPRPR